MSALGLLFSSANVEVNKTSEVNKATAVAETNKRRQTQTALRIGISILQSFNRAKSFPVAGGILLHDHQSGNLTQQVSHNDDAENSFVLFSSNERGQFDVHSATLGD